MKVRKILYVTFLQFLLFVFHLISAYSQNYSVKTFTTEDGLSHNNVRSIALDRSGLLWIGTWDGLCRYDGYEFKSYFHIPGDTASLPYFSVNKVFTDKYDNLWLFTDASQVVRFRRNSETFHVVKSVNGYHLNNVLSISADNESNVWIISEASLIKFSDNTGETEIYRITGSSAGEMIKSGNYSVYKYDEETLWLGGKLTYKIRLDRIRNTAYLENKYDIVNDSPVLKAITFDHNIWFDIQLSKTGRPWIFSNTGLYGLDEGSSSFRIDRGPFNGDDFTTGDDLCWGTDTDGFYTYRIRSKSLFHMPANSAQLLKPLLIKDEETVWFANTSYTGNALGLSEITFVPDYFRKYNLGNELEENAAIYAITMDRSRNIWLGVKGENDIVRISPSGEVRRIPLPNIELSEPSGPIRSFVVTDNGIWIGFLYRLLLFYEFSSGKFTRYDAGSLSYRSLTVDSSGNMYTGSENFRVFNPGKGLNKVIWDSAGIGGIFRLVNDNNKTIWGGLSSSKLTEYDIITGKAINHIVMPGPYNIEDIFPDTDGNLWIAFLGGGVCRYNPDNGNSIFYTTANGLSNNTTYSILKDRNGYVWVSTDNGISRINPETGIIRKFGKADGLSISEFNSGASFISPEGEFFFGGIGGITSFFPERINISEGRDSEQRVILTSLSVSGKYKILKNAIYNTDTVRFNPGEDNFHLTFSCSDFEIAESTIYRYRIDEVNDSWISTNHDNRNINYSNLHSGYYHLTIEATNRQGEWSGSKKLVIKIVPRFYESRLFIISVILLLLFLAGALIYMYIRNIKQAARQTADQLRLQSLQGQMNPHFIFNSLNSINYFISNNDKLSANRYIVNFSRLIRSILSNMGKDYVPFEEEVDSIRDYLEIEHLRFGDKFDYLIDVSAVTKTKEREVLPGLAQPFIENAIWHGMRALEVRKGFVSVRFSDNGPGIIRCIIEDDGIGIEASISRKAKNDNHNSKGISIVSERLGLIGKIRGMNFQIEITDLHPELEETGTRVAIDIPEKQTLN